ncbi:MAG: sporulation protein [Clostridiales bacterium]|nr:sporulation protein [Clostridiales bacterium]
MGVLANRRVMEVAAGLAIFLAIIGLIAFPNDTITAAKDGLSLCFNIILPSLFPFFVLSTLLVELGFARYLGRFLERIMRPLFNVNGTCSLAFALGFIGGYPTGAKTAIAIYEKGLCTRTEAERLLSFCNNSGPSFILGVVGAGIFSSSKAGILLYLAHALASVLVGITFRFYKYRSSRNESKHQNPQIETVNLSAAFTKSVVNSFSSILNICAFVIFFSVTIRLLFLFKIIPGLASFLGTITAKVGGNAEKAELLLTGLIEISSGVWTLRNAAASMREQLVLAAFMLGWAGLSVHCQVLSFIGGSGLNTRTYIGGKILHGIFAAALTYILSGLFSFDAPVASYLVEQLDGISALSFGASLTLSLLVTAALFLGILLFVSIRILFLAQGKRRISSYFTARISGSKKAVRNTSEKVKSNP